jgi:hypothetical protein
MEFHSQIIQYKELTLIYHLVYKGLPLKYQTIPQLFKTTVQKKV